MANLYLDEVKIENSVISDFDIAINYLNSAIKECNKMVIPNDFEFDQYLKQLNNKILNTVTKLKDKKQNLENAKNSYKKIQNINTEELEEMKIIYINKRKKDIEKKNKWGEKNE